MALWVVAWYAPRASQAALGTLRSAPPDVAGPAAQDDTQGSVPGARLRQPYQAPHPWWNRGALDTSAPALAPSYVDGQGLWTVAYFTPRAARAAVSTLFWHPAYDDSAAVGPQPDTWSEVPGARFTQPFRQPRGEFWRLPLDESAPVVPPSYVDGQGLWVIPYFSPAASRASLLSLFWRGAFDDSVVIGPQDDTQGEIPGLRFRQPYRVSRPNLPFAHSIPEGVEAGEGVGLWIVPNWTPRLPRAALYAINHAAFDDSAPPPVAGTDPYVPILRRRRR